MNPAPVEAEPLFETVEESVTALFTVAVVGVTAPAVRLGWAAVETETEFEHATEPLDCPPEVTVTEAVLVPVVE